MTEEQKKVRKFYKDFISWRADSIGMWIAAGFLVMFLLIGCAVPLQEMLPQGGEETELLGWMMVLLFGPLAGFLYLQPYTSYAENPNTNNVKWVRVTEKLKYMPINFGEVRKMKAIYLIRFYAIIAPFCVLLQVLTSMFSYKEVTWNNVMYIVAVAFVWPTIVNLLLICCEREGR